MNSRFVAPRRPPVPWVSLADRARQQASLPPDELTFKQVMVVLVLHLPLIFVFQRVPQLSILHAVLALLLGLHFIIRDERPHRVFWVMAYIAGAEIVWRGVESIPIWEYGKFANMGLAVLALLRYRLLPKVMLWPLLMIALLLPGIFLMPFFDRQAISFQLAGPFALAILSMLFSAIEIRKIDLQRILLAMIAPNMTMAALIAFSLLTGNIAFSGGNANEEVTGGIGANQVTSSISLGASAAFFYIFLAEKDRRIRNLMVAVSVGMMVASVLTFSRAGLWNTLGLVLVAVFFLSRDRWRGSTAIQLLLSLGIISYFVVFPFLVNLTGGALVARFSDFDSTGRDVLVQVDYQVFLDNPVFGVGVGQSIYSHTPYFGYAKPTHTEYGRLLAEHGSLGLSVMVLWLVVTISRFLRRSSAMDKALGLGFIAWGLLYMLHSATRLVAPSLAFGLAMARFALDDDNLSGEKEMPPVALNLNKRAPVVRPLLRR